MAAQFISIARTDSNATHFQKILSVPGRITTLINDLESIVASFYMMDEGAGPGQFALFETKYGIPEGDGQAVFDLVNGTLSALKGDAQTANAVELSNRVG